MSGDNISGIIASKVLGFSNSLTTSDKDKTLKQLLTSMIDYF